MSKIPFVFVFDIHSSKDKIAQGAYFAFAGFEPGAVPRLLKKNQATAASSPTAAASSQKR